MPSGLAAGGADALLQSCCRVGSCRECCAVCTVCAVVCFLGVEGRRAAYRQAVVYFLMLMSPLLGTLLGGLCACVHLDIQAVD